MLGRGFKVGNISSSTTTWRNFWTLSGLECMEIVLHFRANMALVKVAESKKSQRFPEPVIFSVSLAMYRIVPLAVRVGR